MYTQAGGPCTNYGCSLRNNAGYCKVTVCMNPKYNGWSNKEQAIGNSRNVSPDEIKKAVEQYRKQRMTNADRIRAMDDRELTDFLWHRDIQIVERASKAAGFNYRYDEAECKQNIKDWLKSRVEEGE